MTQDAWRSFVDRPGEKLFVLLLAGVLSLLIVLGYQYVKLSRGIDRQTEAGPYPKMVDMHLAFGVPVSLGAQPHRVPSGAETALHHHAGPKPGGSPEGLPHPLTNERLRARATARRHAFSYTRAPYGTVAPPVHTGAGRL